MNIVYRIRSKEKTSRPKTTDQKLLRMFSYSLHYMYIYLASYKSEHNTIISIPSGCLF